MSSENFIQIEPIENILETENTTQIKIYKISKEFEETVLSLLNRVLKHYTSENYIPIIFTILKELTINACKANQKRIFFEEKNYDIGNPEHYEIGIKEFKKIFNESMGNFYGPLCKKKDYYCLILFEYDETGIRIEVRNNTLVTEQEEKSLREKLSKAMSYDDLAQFYMDNADNTEGAGLGLALIVIMLKSEGLDPNLFRISITEEYTSARFELPFNSEYKSLRS